MERVENSMKRYCFAGASGRALGMYCVPMLKNYADTAKICGLCYTQLYDVEQEQNGVYYYDRSAKFDDETMDKLAAVLNKKAAIEEE